jgi:hypothetical protein
VLGKKELAAIQEGAWEMEVQEEEEIEKEIEKEIVV